MCTGPVEIARSPVDSLHARARSSTEPSVKAKPRPPRPPRLTRAVARALALVYRDAEVIHDEAVGCGERTERDIRYRGLEYLDALLEWYWSTHPPNR